MVDCLSVMLRRRWKLLRCVIVSLMPLKNPGRSILWPLNGCSNVYIAFCFNVLMNLVLDFNVLSACLVLLFILK